MIMNKRATNFNVLRIIILLILLTGSLILASCKPAEVFGSASQNTDSTLQRNISSTSKAIENSRNNLERAEAMFEVSTNTESETSIVSDSVNRISFLKPETADSFVTLTAVGTELESQEATSQVGIKTYRTVDLGPICILEDENKSWFFSFWTSSNCKALVSLNWSFEKIEDSPMMNSYEFEKVKTEILKVLALEYLGFYEWNPDFQQWVGTLGIPAREDLLDDLFCPWNEDFSSLESNPVPLFEENKVVGFDVSERQHYLRFTWSRPWDHEIGNWNETLPAGKYKFLINYTIVPYIP